MERKKIAQAIAATVIGVSVVSVAAHSTAAPKDKEKCYGIVKKGKNDCGTASHSCAGQAAKNNDPKEWIYVLKGNCDRITGGTTKS